MLAEASCSYLKTARLYSVWLIVY